MRSLKDIPADTVAPEAIQHLFIDLLREGYIIRSWAVGGSMAPCINKGDVLMVRPIAFGEAGIGEIVAYRKDESHSVLTTHRVVARGKDADRGYLITQGTRTPIVTSLFLPGIFWERWWASKERAN